MLIKTIPVGQLETNCYVVTNEDTLESVVIDPGDEVYTGEIIGETTRQDDIVVNVCKTKKTHQYACSRLRRQNPD